MLVFVNELMINIASPIVFVSFALKLWQVTALEVGEMTSFA
jgi:hypothetical protein